MVNTEERSIADTRSSDTRNVNNERQLRQLSANTAAERDNRQRQSRQQDDLLRRYLQESASLKGDIQHLQQSVNNNDRNYRGSNTILPVVIPPTQTQQLVAAPVGSRRDTVYLKDTIHIRDTVTLANTDIVNPMRLPAPIAKDTLRIRDTLTLTKIEIINPVAAAPITRDTVIRQTPFDYTAIPADIILFGLGKANLQPVYHNRLNYIAGILRKDATLQASITGHTDKSGSPEINKALSLKRAQNVAAYLANKGVASTSLVTDAVSSLEPAIAGNSRSASSQNRRVVIKIIKK